MLTAEQIRSFEENGYLVVENVLDQEAVIEPIRAEYATLLDALYGGWRKAGLVGPDLEELDFEGRLLAAYKAGCDWFQPMDISLPGDRIHPNTPFHFGPAVFGLVTNPRLLDLVEDFIGPEITSNPIQHVRIKPPASDLHGDEIRAHITATDWHQDRGVTHADADHTTMITVWCAISDATAENGCLRVIPGAHLDGLMPHRAKTQAGIDGGLVDEAKAVPLPVKSGGVILFHPLTPHASLVNRSSRFRWSFDLRYNRRGQPTGRAHFPDFVARSRANPESELKSWKTWRGVWKDARARLAASPHVEIHRWRAESP
jgi:ectoine hydroxylase-related dioxygenase (phytanoyl-CoA dioxygenase family)